MKVDFVTESVADYLWNKSHDYSPGASPFVIKGSYAAVAWAQMNENSDLLKTLSYNDIDVFVEAPADSSKCQNKKKRGFITSRYVQNVIPHSSITVQVTVVCELNTDELIKQSDMNAVNVGFKVVPKSEQILEWGEVTTVPEIESWSWTSHFETFVKTKKLEIVYTQNGYHENMIRMLRKAQEMELEYKLPDYDEEKLHGAVLAPNYMKSYAILDSSHKSEITSRFDLLPIPGRDQWSMVVVKGKDVPEFPRKLQSNYYYGSIQDIPTDPPVDDPNSGSNAVICAKLVAAAAAMAAALVLA